ncbi:MAG: hypothetical protein WCK51_11115 [Armatimonadota bacterium]
MKHLGDIKSARMIHVKGWLFLLLAAIAVAGLLVPEFRWQNLALICIAIWAACRWYYYLFYVIEHYVDSTFRFASVSDALRYLLRRSKK